MIPEDRMEAFLTELRNLEKKHGVEVGGCGCCGSPFAMLTGDEGQIILCEDHIDNWQPKLKGAPQ